MARKIEAEAGGALKHPFPWQTSSVIDANTAKTVVSFLGPIASYSHQAVLQTFPREKWELRPASTITDVFEKVQSRQAPVGVVPFENSSNGCVVETFDSFADRDKRYRDIVVHGEIYIDVNHCLLGKRSPVDAAVGTAHRTTAEESSEKSPDSGFGYIKQLYSHPQALGQCRRFISTDLGHAETLPVSSTSRAAELVAHGRDEASAAISSKLAASVYGLDVLAETIQDRRDNTTRFLIIGNLQNTAENAPAVTQSLSGTKSLVSFTVPHDSPGALAGVLCCFDEQKLNLTSINTRPSLLAPFQYVFFVEFEGHRYDQDGRVERALEKIGRVAKESRWLGSWERYR
ncbi:hypothetical protein L249_8012 [Ophiocordyceps polyrhachis-furcata BCC 54312]|uniref:prephenate dehydratase n=1 Tax=Ophiocordyceps polyrhachis-furcata BCC 54312 TaxID=1330021 RepID=A0A367LI32_9HYPO|nr:hypothetical protein L249_8012 [Ophiocordyceps polyrhachis-furcata BCC 54312]